MSQFVGRDDAASEQFPFLLTLGSVKESASAKGAASEAASV